MSDSAGDLTKHLISLLKSGGCVHDPELDPSLRALDPDLNIGAQVFTSLKTFVSRFLVFPTEHARNAYALWAGHAYLMDAWSTTPRLLFVSPEVGSGKTAAMEIMSLLAPLSDLFEDATPASLYTDIDESPHVNGCRPTLFFDEIDKLYGPRRIRSKNAEDLRGLIDGGYRRSGTVRRKEGKTIRRYKVYAAMALAGQMLAGDVPASIRSRSIIIPMQWAAPGEIKPEDYWNSEVHAPLVTPYRDMLAMWAELVTPYALAHPGVEIPKGITNRDRDVWQPLLAVAQLAGGEWPEIAAVSAVSAVSASGAESEPSEGRWLLWEIKAIFTRLKVDRIHTTGLLDELRSTGRFGWTRQEAQVAAIRLAQMLQAYGVEPPTPGSRDQRINGVKAKGWRAEWFEDAWRRYAPRPETPETPETHGSGQS